MDFSSIIHFLTDKTRNLSSKAAFIILILLLIILLDNTLSFSYYYNTSQKVTQIREISEGLKDPTLSGSEREKLLELRTDIIDHKTLKDRAYDYLTNLNFEGSDKPATEIIQAEPKRNPTIHLLTSAWWILIPLAIIGIALPFVLLSERKDVFTTTLGFIFMGGFGYLISLLLSKAFSFIPLINNNPSYNYGLNFILSGLILWFFIIMSKRSKDKTIANNE